MTEDSELGELIAQAKRLGLYMARDSEAFRVEIKNRIKTLISVKGSELRPHPKNPRRHPEGQVSALRGVLEEVGIAGALLVYEAGDGKLTLIDGECRTANFAEETWPCLLLDVDDAEAELLLATHDPLAMLAENDAVALEELLESLRCENAAVNAMLADVAKSAGASLGDGDITEEATVVDGDSDKARELAETWGVATGQIWNIPSLSVPGGVHRIVCADAIQRRNIDALMGSAKPDILVTDPPYGVDYDASWRVSAGLGDRSAVGRVANDDRCDWTAVYELCQVDVAYIWHAAKFAAEVQRSIEAAGFEVITQIIWAKSHFALSRGDYHWQHEPCWYAVKKGATHNWQGARDQSSVWGIAGNDATNADREKVYGHSTQKPLECMARPIRNNTSRGQTVIDPFLGSGTTLIAAEKLGRICFGAEIMPAYLAVILQRCADNGLTPVLSEVACGRE